MTYARALVVAAHPDDETLGCGGTLARLGAEGTEIHVLFLSDGVGARGAVPRSAIDARRSMGDRAAEKLGVRPPAYLDFEDNRMDAVPLLDVVTAIERHAADIQPEIVFTHFPGDLNVDHRICAQAAITAFRPLPGQTVRSILAFEVPSSTEWGFGCTGESFTPNMFFDISQHLERKLAALGAYAEEMRPFPHPRSREAVEALARWRGASLGTSAAEAFLLLRALH